MRFVPRDRGQHGVHGELAGAIEIPALESRRVCDGAPERARDGLASQGQREISILGLEGLRQAQAEELLGVGRGGLHHVDPGRGGAVGAAGARGGLAGSGEQFEDGFGVDALCLLGDRHRGAGDQPEDRVPSGVEAQPAQVEHPRQRRRAALLGRADQPVLMVVQHVAQCAVRHLHALRRARGPRGVDQVRRVRRLRTRRRGGTGGPLEVLSVESQQLGALP